MAVKENLLLAHVDILLLLPGAAVLAAGAIREVSAAAAAVNVVFTAHYLGIHLAEPLIVFMDQLVERLELLLGE